MIPSLKKYPGPTARAAKNTTFNPTRPDGTHYSSGTRYGSTKRDPMHGGIDLVPTTPGREGEDLYAGWGGRVVFAGWGVWGGKSYGWQVILKHWHRHADGTDHHWYSGHNHMHSPSPFRAGDQVHADTVVGHVGKTGYGTNAHSHWIVQARPEHKSQVVDFKERAEARRQKELAA